jgi:hypothetical protein
MSLQPFLHESYIITAPYDVDCDHRAKEFYHIFADFCYIKLGRVWNRVVEGPSAIARTFDNVPRGIECIE